MNQADFLPWYFFPGDCIPRSSAQPSPHTLLGGMELLTALSCLLSWEGFSFCFFFFFNSNPFNVPAFPPREGAWLFVSCFLPYRERVAKERLRIKRLIFFQRALNVSDVTEALSVIFVTQAMLVAGRKPKPSYSSRCPCFWLRPSEPHSPIPAVLPALVLLHACGRCVSFPCASVSLWQNGGRGTKPLV